jgi:hypothetical protein
MGVAIPLEALSPRDRQYATVQFRDTKAARKALELNGIVVDGCSLVVRLGRQIFLDVLS